MKPKRALDSKSSQPSHGGGRRFNPYRSHHPAPQPFADLIEIPEGYELIPSLRETDDGLTIVLRVLKSRRVGRERNVNRRAA